MYNIGIDLGTSSVKIILVDEKGYVEKSCTREYPLFFPAPGWSEQNPEDWWNACISGILELIEGNKTDQIKGIGVAGQMHGLVALDKNDSVIRPAILWNDGRTADEVDYLNSSVGKENLSSWTANIAFAGFTAPKLLWLKKHEPENFARIHKIMLPKDYINYKLTGGIHSCDYSDASGMLLLDVQHKCWADKMLDLCDIGKQMMPSLHNSFEVIGSLTPAVAATLHLPPNIKVIAGAGDNAAAAIGNGTVGDGSCNISLGTSGTLFISSKEFKVDQNNALHSFVHANGDYHLLACMLSAASCNRWFCSDILGTDNYSIEQKALREKELGKNNVFFLPYLMGERSPINDTDARALFIGMTMDTKRSNLVQAVLEGVSFAIRDSYEIATSLGIPICRTNLCGGGSKSPIWREIITNVLGIPTDYIQSEQGPAYGAAILSKVGCGQFRTVSEAVDSITSHTEVITIDPNTRLTALYDERYQHYKKIYPTVKSLFKNQ